MRYEQGDIVEISIDEGETWIRGVYVMPSTSIDNAHIVRAPQLFPDPHVIDANIRRCTAMGTTTKCPCCVCPQTPRSPHAPCAARSCARPARAWAPVRRGARTVGMRTSVRTAGATANQQRSSGMAAATHG